MTTSFVERERKFDVRSGFQIPESTEAVPPGSRSTGSVQHLRSEYFDTVDRALQRAAITFRRRTGTAIAAANSPSFEPKNCMTCEGSTPASVATRRMVVPVNPSVLNRVLAASSTAWRELVRPGLLPPLGFDTASAGGMRRR